MAYEFNTVKVLVAEDNAPMQELIRSLLITFGIENYIPAKNGEEAFQAFCKHNPDIVIADWMMNPIDGISLVRKIRTSSLSPNPFVPVILMTGFSEKRQVIEARDSGITEFLVKPFNARDLYRRLSQIIEKPRQFVRTENFFGPDRRRKSNDDYKGPLRRDEDDGYQAAYSSTDQVYIDMIPDTRKRG